MTRRSRAGSVSERGFTLVELMIAMGLSLMILAGLVTVFVNNSNTRKEIERTTRQIENGRYAIELLSNNLILAGFYAEFDPSTLPDPGSVPEACSTDLTDDNKRAQALALPIQGYRSATTATAGLDCLTDLKDNTDVVVVRRTGTCIAGATDCGDPLTSGDYYYFQASLCTPTTGNAELAGTVTDAYRLLTTTATTSLNRHRRCTASPCVCANAPFADIRRYHTHIYFVANNSVGADGVPTLKRAELTGGGWTIVPLVEGIENLKLEYGIDSAPAIGDGMPDEYTPTPDTVANWRNVTSVKLYLLARNTEPSPGYTNSKTYTLGSDTPPDQPYTDAYRRHVFSTTVKLANVAGRRGI